MGPKSCDFIGNTVCFTNTFAKVIEKMNISNYGKEK